MADIRKFFLKRKSENSETSDESKVKIVDVNCDESKIKVEKIEKTDESDFNECDVGHYVNSAGKLNDKVRNLLLFKAFEPSNDYDFKEDVAPGSKRWFVGKWLVKYSTWLVYSQMLKGPICKLCVLFPQPVQRGHQGRFITKPCFNYKDFHAACDVHTATEWHRAAVQDATNFKAVMRNPERDIPVQVTGTQAVILHNRSILHSIISGIVHCATHDQALRGKTNDSGNVVDLWHYAIESGDTVLKTHFENAANNAKYTSGAMQNKFIEIAGQVLRNDIITEVNNAECFAILADETADISGTEQMSIGVRYVDSHTNPNEPEIKEQLLGFTPIVGSCDADHISQLILSQCRNYGLDLSKMVGQGYDGCSTMAGKENGVQARIRRQFPRAVFVHCASHRLNLVVNDLNALPEIRNTTGSVKSVIKYIRDSPQRRALFPNIPLLCETRWSSKYKSIRLFSENYVEIHGVFERLSRTLSGENRQKAHQHHCVLDKSTFIICLAIIAKYSGYLESVANTLQSVNMDISQCRDHIQSKLSMFESHRQDADCQFKTIFEGACQTANDVGLDITIPRRCSAMKFRANHDPKTPEEYYRVALYIPYMDSIINSLRVRFCENNAIMTSLAYLHPRKIAKTPFAEYSKQMKIIAQFYGIDNFVGDSESWYYDHVNRSADDVPLIKVLDQCSYYPAVKQALLVYLTLPATTCTVERSFSGLRRVKTWLRNTMTDNRLSGLCMLSVHRVRVNTNKWEFIEKVIDAFDKDGNHRWELEKK